MKKLNNVVAKELGASLEELEASLDEKLDIEDVPLAIQKRHTRSRAYYREVRNKAIRRKKNICKHIYWDGCDWYEHDGQYSKNKIHCSCWMCTYSKYYGLPKLKDLKDKERMEASLEYCYEEGII